MAARGKKKQKGFTGFLLGAGALVAFLLTRKKSDAKPSGQTDPLNPLPRVSLVPATQTSQVSDSIAAPSSDCGCGCGGNCGSTTLVSNLDGFNRVRFT